MNPVQVALERVALLDPKVAGQLLHWLDMHQPPPAPANEAPLGAKAMIGFALREGRRPRTTAQWMKELREGE